jgi:hypothetical protein
MNILGILALATLVEGFVEYAFGKIVQLQPFLIYISLLLGVGVSIAYHVDILAELGLHGAPIVGYIISGVIIGRGSNYANDIISLVKGQNAAKPTVLVVPPTGAVV